MQLSESIIDNLEPEVNLQYPSRENLKLPEKVLQFGTGALLRGLPDYFFDKANRKNIFNGRVVMVKSTNQGSIQDLIAQNNLYTLCVRGIEDDKEIKENYLNSATSRILIAKNQWQEVLDCASNEDLKIVVSNTTEVGIQLMDDNIHDAPPKSFPGKLLAFLYARYEAFSGDESKGLVIIPTELIIDNGDKLKEILVLLAQQNELEEEFIQWLKNCNHFCNSLVDRIVPGAPDEKEKKALKKELGYCDQYMIKAEPYRLWAIEAKEKKVRDILSFAEVDKGVILADDISKYRTLKIRLLNGTHTFSCALAYLSGLDTVREAMMDEDMGDFIQDLMDEIINTISGEDISRREARIFANEVADRFRNPFNIHKWLSISVQYTSKVKMRNVPLIINYSKKFRAVPKAMAKGLAAYILFMCSEKQPDGTFVGTREKENYPIKDDLSGKLYDLWKQDPNDPVEAILSDVSLWGTDLTKINGLVNSVRKHVFQCLKAHH
ncbi:MAG TPA: tagaturonate reductase [Chitinophagaceae bacterium]|nr:tagaturonate reductase [Chitinophagaceae bacterium]